MRASLAALVCSFVLMPLFAFAASGNIPAGFAPTSIFASKTSITAGDTISLFSVLYNSSSDDLAADIVFTIDGTSVGTKHVSLAAGETQTPSITWTATSGSHTASAHLENVVSSSGEGAPALNATADTITLTVSQPPPPTATAAAVANITNIVASGTQSAAPIAHNAYNSLEYLRANAVSVLKRQLAAGGATDTTVSTHPAVLGTSTSNVATPEQGGILSTLWRTLLRGLLFICSIQILFYLSLLVVLYILYKLVRMIFSERAHRY